MIKVYSWKEVAKRAVWTFVQAAGAIVLAAGTDYINMETLKAAGIGGIAAVLSFIKNVVVQTKNSGTK